MGNSAIYEIKVSGDTNKYGKADLDRITKKSGLPTRLHQQIEKLKKIYDEVQPVVREKLYNVSTKYVKEIENLYIKKYYDTYKVVPPGNKKSFKP